MIRIGATRHRPFSLNLLSQRAKTPNVDILKKLTVIAFLFFGKSQFWSKNSGSLLTSESMGDQTFSRKSVLMTSDSLAAIERRVSLAEDGGSGYALDSRSPNI